MKNKIETVYQVWLDSLFQNNPLLQLIKVNLFAIGPIGYAGLVLQEQRFFKNVLLSKRPIKIFRKVLSKGSNEAKAYALLGLYFLSPRDYEQAKNKFRGSNDLVRCIHGQTRYAQTFPQLFEEIESGYFKIGSLESTAHLVSFVGGT